MDERLAKFAMARQWALFQSQLDQTSESCKPTLAWMANMGSVPLEIRPSSDPRQYHWPPGFASRSC